MERSIAVYHDEGTGVFSRGALIEALAQHYSGRARVRRIFAAEIAASDRWHDSTQLLAIPGGADAPYVARLSGAGNASIRRYLEGGGALFAVCAGAYYTAARVSFEAASPRELTGSRELALFCGTARGSLHELAEPYAVEHLRCADVVPLRAAGHTDRLHALYWGGPELVPDPGSSHVPLLWYELAERREALAALRVEVGRGRAVLTGVHACPMNRCTFRWEVLMRPYLSSSLEKRAVSSIMPLRIAS